MHNLIGKRCSCEFDMPHYEWPIEGSPAWVKVLDVRMPMIEMASAHAGRPVWVNAARIKSIRALPDETQQAL
jgi:protein involved in temperature-dependent protein secretion